MERVPGDGRPVRPEVVAAIVAALAAHLGTVPSALEVRSVRPRAAPVAGAWPPAWAWAGRRDLMGERAAMLWGRR